MKTTMLCVLGLAFACASAHAANDEGMQVQTDSMTGAIMSPSDDPKPKGRLDGPPPKREHVTGVQPAAEPAPHLRQGPLGGTMVETPDYMRPNETVHMPAQNDSQAAGHD